nr:leucine-rich repeat receptor-like serine/threonine-protein kinase bam1 [Quercus suber]
MGITCSDTTYRHVTSLDLSDLNLSGTFSPDLAHLRLLTNLSPPSLSASPSAQSKREGRPSLTRLMLQGSVAFEGILLQWSLFVLNFSSSEIYGLETVRAGTDKGFICFSACSTSAAVYFWVRAEFIWGVTFDGVAKVKMFLK